MKQLRILLVLVALTACGKMDPAASNVAVSPAMDKRAAELAAARSSIQKFYSPMRVQEGDWLDAHPEDGETFEEYIRSNPTLPTPERSKIYVQPVGVFTTKQMEAIRLTADYLQAFYSLPVVLRDEVPADGVPKDMVRIQYPNNRQIRTSYFIDDILPKMLPDDAAALICFTNYDLYPGDTWNFVFGQASLERRVGVWSLWRLEKDGQRRASYQLFLDRTLKVAMHETGHMFSMRHCTKYECLMSGTNHLEETDRRPLDTCPECTMKIAWAMKYGPAERYNRLAEFWRKRGRSDEQKRMQEKSAAVSAVK